MADMVLALKSFVFFAFVLMLPDWASGWKREGRHVITEPPPRGPTLPPVFDSSTPTNVTVTAAKTAMLSCVVHNLGNNTVSWIRNRDLHILSVGPTTYTTDSRFQAVPHNSSGNWFLRIRYAHPRDSGQYDCQVSSRPPTARTTLLTVVEPQAKILRSPEMHVGLGSLINLTCVVPYSPEPPDYLHWYHKEKMVRKDGGRVFIDTHLGVSSESQLVVKYAKAEDSGIYTCSPAHSREDYITVHVLTGEYPAAMQRGSSLLVSQNHGYFRSMCVCLSVTLSTTVSHLRHWHQGDSGLRLKSIVTAITLAILHYFYM